MGPDENFDEFDDDEDPFGESLLWRTFGTTLKEVAYKRNIDPLNLSPVRKKTPYAMEVILGWQPYMGDETGDECPILPV
eukprot:1636343-Prorocentrum_lima.AAC.1